MSSNGDNYSDTGATNEDSVHYSDEEENVLQGRRRAVSLDFVSQPIMGDIEGGVGVAGGSKVNIPPQEEQPFSSRLSPDPGSWGHGTSWKDLPIAKLDAQKFCSRLEMFSSAPVTILVGEDRVAFTLPKDVLCHHSKYMKVCLTGQFREAKEEKITLEEDSIESFQLIVQWMFTGNLILPWDMDVPDQITALLGFLKLGDKFDLAGSVSTITDTLRNILIIARTQLPTRTSCKHPSGTWAPSTPCKGHPITSPGAWGVEVENGAPLSYCVDYSINPDPLRDNVITAQHIRTAFELPSGHEARNILTDACVTSYLLKAENGNGWDPPPSFKFQKELDTVRGFKHDLLEAVRKSVHLLALRNGHNSLVIDPLTGAKLSI